jgi:hypothetical protein
MCMLHEKRRPHQNTYLSDRRSGCCLCFFSRLGEAPRGALDGDSTDCRVTARERLIPALSPASSPLNARPLPNFLPPCRPKPKQVRTDRRSVRNLQAPALGPTASALYDAGQLGGRSCYALHVGPSGLTVIIFLSRTARHNQCRIY